MSIWSLTASAVSFADSNASSPRSFALSFAFPHEVLGAAFLLQRLVARELAFCFLQIPLDAIGIHFNPFPRLRVTFPASPVSQSPWKWIP